MYRIIVICVILCFLFTSCISDKDKEEILAMVNSTSSSQSSSSSVNSSSSSQSISSDAESSGAWWKEKAEKDHELSVPDDWKSSTPPRSSNPDSYPFENDSSVPDLDFDSSSKPYDVAGEGTTGEHGDTWELPEWDMPSSLPMDSDDLNIPDMP